MALFYTLFSGEKSFIFFVTANLLSLRRTKVRLTPSNLRSSNMKVFT